MNIIDLIKGQFGHGVAAHLASQLGETEANTSKAIQAFIPAVLGGMIAQTDHPRLLKEITNLADTSVLAKLSQNTPESNELLASVLSLVYGDKVDTLMSGVASFADIKPASSAALLGFTTLTSLATVGRYAKEQNLDAEGLKNLLNQEKTNFSNLLPADFSLAAVGLGHAEQFFDKAKEKITEVTENLGDKVAQNANDAKEKISAFTEETKDKVSDFAENAKEKMADFSGEVKDSVSEKLEDAKDFVSEKTEAVKSVFHQAEEKVQQQFGDESKEEVSIWKWLIPLVLLLLMGWFVWKLFNKKEEIPTTPETPAQTVDSVQVDTAEHDTVDTLSAQ